jgi:hypothetical protein
MPSKKGQPPLRFFKQPDGSTFGFQGSVVAGLEPATPIIGQGSAICRDRRVEPGDPGEKIASSR